MRIYFSGARGIKCTPEKLIPDLKPHIMLTFHDIGSNGTIDRLNVYLRRKGFPLVERTGKKKEKFTLPEDLYTQSMFMDSGAYSLYNLHVRSKVGDRWPTEPRDYHFYSLKKGSEFRTYCDNYGKWMVDYADAKMLWTNVDAIRGPETTWQIQQFFEKEYGLTPVPVVHAGTPLKYLDRYLEAGHYKLIGLGGLGQNIGIEVYRRWANQVFAKICPESNKFLPTVRTHGFAMTSSDLIQMWPWWSVDSATWVKLAAYGWLYVPWWCERKEAWDFSRPPIHFNVSAKSKMAQKHLRMWKKRFPTKCESIERWIAHLGMDLGSLELSPNTDHKDQSSILRDDVIGKSEVAEDFEEDSLSGHFVNRSVANLHFLKGLEQSRPKWPHALDQRLAHRGGMSSFGL